MKIHPATGIQERVWANRSRHTLTVLILLVLTFVILGVIAVLTRAQNPNCVDLKKRLDDTTRAYQTVLMQSQSVDKNYTSYRSADRKLRNDLTVNEKKREQAERNLFEAQRDGARCDRDLDVLPDGGCAKVTQRIAAAEKNIAYARANRTRLEADLLTNQQRLATTKATLDAANADLTSAQQDLEAANHAYAIAGCATENNK
jgi:chromosome segregation ATPase